MDFKGAAKAITDLDIPRIGAEIGVGEDELHAFMDVEAAGRAFDSQGRPAMLFEPHRFYANLSGAKRAAAVAKGLAYPKWGEKPYPKESYTRIAAAMLIDEEAALRSASWGLTQIMGQYHADLGYATARAMVEAFMDSAASHLEATVHLLKLWGVDDDLRAHRWATVAKVWNGPGYAKNAYDTRIAAAFARWQKIRDTKWPPDGWKAPAAAAQPGVIVVPIAPAPEAEKPAPTVVTMPVPSADPQPQVVVTTTATDNAPAAPALPKGKSGWIVLSSIIAVILAAVAKLHFGG